MICAAIRKLFAADSPRDRHRHSTRLRPALTALEGRRLLSNFVVNNPTDTPVTGQTDLRQAIEEANSARGFNTITFSSVFNTAQTIKLMSGPLDVKHDTLTIDGPAAGLTVSGDDKTRILAVESNATVQISNLTITGGHESNDYGGGVYNRGTLTLENCTVTKNVSQTHASNDYGGGIYNVDGKLTMLNSTVSNNTVGTKSQNDPHDAFGGGIANYGGTVDLVNCAINNNTGYGDFIGSGGGGLYNYGRAYLTNCTFAGNDGDNGGGLDNHGDAEVVSCTFSQNKAWFGGGMLLWKSLDMWDTIVANNTTKWKGPDVDGDVHSGGNDNPRGGYNLIGNTAHSSGWVSTKAGGTDLTSVNPGLTNLGNNGGPTQTMALSSSSPAIHNGTKVTYAGTDKPLVSDQRGLPLDTPPDIGAYQTQTG